jgi:hypothetical protein
MKRSAKQPPEDAAKNAFAHGINLCLLMPPPDLRFILQITIEKIDRPHNYRHKQERPGPGKDL